MNAGKRDSFYISDNYVSENFISEIYYFSKKICPNKSGQWKQG